MRTTISLPDDTYALASRYAAQMSVSLSAFFAAAAVHYLDELDSASLTERINSAMSALESDASSQDAVALAHRFPAEDW